MTTFVTSINQRSKYWTWNWNFSKNVTLWRVRRWGGRDKSWNSIFASVRQFNETAVTEILAKFPFNDYSWRAGISRSEINPLLQVCQGWLLRLLLLPMTKWTAWKWSSVTSVLLKMMSYMNIIHISLLDKLRVCYGKNSTNQILKVFAMVCSWGKQRYCLSFHIQM